MYEIKKRIALDVEVGHISASSRILEHDYPVHWHSYFEIEYICEGEAIHTLNGVDTRIDAGSLFLINPTDFHEVKVVSPLKLINISFDETVLSEARIAELSSPVRQKYFKLDSLVAEKVIALARILEAEVLEPMGGCSRELCESILTVILREEREHTVTRTTADTPVGRAIMFLNMHFREDPPLSVTAAQAGLHPHYFSEIFKRETGENYSHYLNSLKIRYAKTMLESGFSVTDTCHCSGFGSLSNFLSVFKQEIGISPKEYKNRYDQR